MAGYEDVAERVEDLALSKGAKAKGKGQRGKGRGGGTGGPDREVLISKALSSLLRHRASDAGIELDPEGFAPLDRVVSIALVALPSLLT
jgi:2'-phosphotransferase